ncbi:MAG: hypothetical protein Q9M97_05315, partial [Candidatus Gracilibacteria bacterium]|nr:hypothetical protein [Candidatus Gracilibacteria bacterium]
MKDSYSQSIILKDIVDIWTDAASREASSEMFEMFKIGDKTDGKILNKQIDIVGLKMKTIFEKINRGEKNDTKSIREVFNEMFKAEKAETSISNLKEISTELLNVTKSNFETKRKKILNLMRTTGGGFSEGNSKMVTSKMGDILLEKDDFKDIKAIINNNSTFALIESGNKTKLVTLGIPLDLAEDLIEKRGEIKRLQEKNIEIFQEAVRKENPALEGSGTVNFNNAVRDKIELATNYSIQSLLKEGLLFNKLENNEKLEKKYHNYSDMVGVGTFTFSDDNVAGAVEIGLILATSLVPIGAGLKAAGLVGKGVNALGKTIRYSSLGTKASLRVANIAAKGPGYAKAAKFLQAMPTIAGVSSKIGLQGLAFYETSNVLHNAMFEKHIDNLAKGWDDGTEIAKSIAFFGVMAGFSKFVNLAKVKSLGSSL